MAATWITNSSTNVVSMVNTINAACDEGFVPDRIHMLENPDGTEQVAEAMDRATTIVETYGETPPDVHVTTLDDVVQPTN